VIREWRNLRVTRRGPGRVCSRQRCQQDAGFVVHYEYRSEVTGAMHRAHVLMCREHAEAWAAQGGIPFPDINEAPAGDTAGAFPQTSER